MVKVNRQKEAVTSVREGSFWNYKDRRGPGKNKELISDTR